MSASEIDLDPVLSEAVAPRPLDAAPPAEAERSDTEPAGAPAAPEPAAEPELAISEPAAAPEPAAAEPAAAPEPAAVEPAATPEPAAVEPATAPAPARVPIVVERRPPLLFPVPDERKRALLLELLESGQLGQVVVFARTKHRANRVAEWLAKRGVVADRIHSQRSHRQRKDALIAFREGKCRVLVAAARAGRMLEVEIPCAVVHFDMPETVLEWKERLGERASALPVELETFFVSELDEPRMAEIESELGGPVERRMLDGFDYTVQSQPAPAVEDRREEPRPVEASPERRAKPKSRRSKKGRRGGAGGAERPSTPGGNGAIAPGAGDDFDDDDEARIRAIAEAQQAAAVAARFSPSRMGIMELRSGPAGGGRSSRKRAHRGGGRAPF